MNALPLKKMLPLWLRGYNALVGKKRVFSFSLGDQPHTLFFSDGLAGYQPNFTVKIVSNNTAFWLGLEDIEGVAAIAQQFQGAALKSLPVEIAPMVLESMIMLLLESVEKKLQGVFSLEQCLWGAPPTSPGTFPLYFEIRNKETASNSLRGHFLLEEPALELFLSLCSKYPSAAAVAVPYESIPFSFNVEVGSTTLTLEEYTSVRLGDIILLGDGSLIQKQCARFRCGTLQFTGKLEEKTVKITEKMEDKNTPLTTAANPRPAAAAAPAKLVPAVAVTPKATPPAPSAASNMASAQASVDNLPVLISFELSKKQFTLNEIKALQVGYTFELETPLDAPVTICANALAIGQGELVQVNERVGVRVTEFFSHDGI